MIEVRRATVYDVAEVIRLRVLMHAEAGRAQSSLLELPRPTKAPQARSAEHAEADRAQSSLLELPRPTKAPQAGGATAEGTPGAGSSSSTGPGYAEPDWASAADAFLRRELTRDEPTVAVFVVDAGDRLAACATGLLQHRIPGPRNASGLTGYVSNVSTDLPHRRRGYARACMTALLDWFVQCGAQRADLRSSPEAEGLYRSLGFERTADPSMVRRL